MIRLSADENFWLAIFVGCLGLFGLTVFMANRYTFIIALATVAYRYSNAAVANPTQSLRSE